MKKKYILLLCFLFSLFSFVLLSKYEDRTFVRNLDLAVTVKLQDWIDNSTHLRLSAFVGNLMEGATFFASPEFTVLITVIIFGVTIYDRRKRKWNIQALMIPVALLLLVLVEVYSKSIVHHPSPPFSMIRHPTTVFPADYINDQFSYPSGHAARAVFLALLVFSVVRSFRKKITEKRIATALGLGAYVGLVSISRIYLGHHWFSDVMGGLLLGLGLGLFTLFVVRGRGNMFGKADEEPFQAG